MRIAVTGATGRMGRTLIQRLADARDAQLSAAMEHAQSEALGRDAGDCAGVGSLGVPITADLAAGCAGSDCVIDFTVPAGTIALLEAAEAAGTAVVLGTTGFTSEQQRRIEQAATRLAVLQAPNMSVGVNLLFQLVRIAADAIGDATDVELLEAHHRNKIDAPSGTAVRLGQILADRLGRNLDTDAVYGRQGQTGARDDKTIGFATVRAGDIVGEHTVLFAGTGERLELTHRATSRDNFAIGALRAAAYVCRQPPGLYSMEDLLGFS